MVGFLVTLLKDMIEALEAPEKPVKAAADALCAKIKTLCEQMESASTAGIVTLGNRIHATRWSHTALQINKIAEGMQEGFKLVRDSMEPKAMSELLYIFPFDLSPGLAAELFAMGLLDPVSTEMGRSTVSRSALMTGMTLSSSSDTLTSAAPGRVDSPPTSIIEAPSCNIASAWRRATSIAAK